MEERMKKDIFVVFLLCVSFTLFSFLYFLHLSNTQRIMIESLQNQVESLMQERTDPLTDKLIGDLEKDYINLPGVLEQNGNTKN